MFHAITQIEIDEVLIRNTCFSRHVFKIIHHICLLSLLPTKRHLSSASTSSEKMAAIVFLLLTGLKFKSAGTVHKSQLDSSTAK
jgi:hypothetical protein